ncbi:MAG: DUF4136 domain-containing protein [Burkholderiales bacterium]|nr:DUF4136 domain-containing protein [Burkholderiales bacterium]
MKALLSTLLAAALLAGCATLNQLGCEVTSYGSWPAGRKPGTYAFDRLPSQQAQPAEADAVEAEARPALEQAGFVAAAPGQAPDVLVQVGLRATRTEVYVWDDPMWWHGGFGPWRRGPWPGPFWGPGAGYAAPRYGSEAGVLLRDRASGKPLYESHAGADTGGRTDPAIGVALFQAALMDLPHTGINPRRVVVPLAP